MLFTFRRLLGCVVLSGDSSDVVWKCGRRMGVVVLMAALSEEALTILPPNLKFCSAHMQRGEEGGPSPQTISCAEFTSPKLSGFSEGVCITVFQNWFNLTSGELEEARLSLLGLFWSHIFLSPKLRDNTSRCLCVSRVLSLNCYLLAREVALMRRFSRSPQWKSCPPGILQGGSGSTCSVRTGCQNWSLSLWSWGQKPQPAQFTPEHDGGLVQGIRTLFILLCTLSQTQLNPYVKTLPLGELLK